MKSQWLGITIDRSRDKLLTEQGGTLVKTYYLRGHEKSPQEAYARAAVAFSAGDLELAQRIYDAVSQGWFMFSSPILSNANAEYYEGKGLPISCFLTYVPDSIEGLIDHQAELAYLSVRGGGVGGHWNDVRSVSKKAPGPIPFIKVADSAMSAYRQGETRRGSYAAYTDINHPDIIEFLEIRKPTGGDANRKCFNIHNAVNLTDDFMDAVSSGSDWDLVDPNSGDVKDTVPARKLWERVLETRFRTGEPYLNFIDEANRQLPKPLKDKGLKINGSNLCNEIHLPTSEDRTAVCCLSSVNLEKYDDWNDTTLVADLITMLDNVIDVFVKEAPKALSKAVYSATRERSLGLGAMGFHSYLQSKNIPWESAMAVGRNRAMFENIKTEAVKATENLAILKGEYPDGKGSGRRNSHLLAVAPNANSSMICHTSASIEPIKSNYYVHKTRVGSHSVKNPYLEKVLEEHRLRLGEDLEWLKKEWASILSNEGSVQQLECLTDWEKDTFKTAFELDQNWVVQHSSDRQEQICQGQSVNLFFPAGSDINYVSTVHMRAWKQGMKGLYYLRTQSSGKAENVGQKVERVELGDCLACEG